MGVLYELLYPKVAMRGEILSTWRLGTLAPWRVWAGLAVRIDDESGERREMRRDQGEMKSPHN